MNLKSLSDEKLHQKTVALVHEERCLTTAILQHLREIAVRRLFAVMGYSSLWEYCIKELKYSEAAAQRRIAAMKLICEFPEAEEKIKEGKLSLSVVSQIQTACKGDPQLKREALSQVEGRSARQAEKILAKLAPQPALPEKRRILSDKQTEVRFVVSERLDAKLERIKALTSRKMFNPGFAELIEMMADLVLDRIDSARKQPPKRLAPPPTSEVTGEGARADASGSNVTAAPIRALARARYVRVKDRRALHERAGSRCEYVHPATRRRCEETRGLEVDHVMPFALGGTNEMANLQLLCAAHNRLRAVQVYGERKMGRYLSR